MVLDTSAIIAVYLRESGYERLIAKIEAASIVLVGVPTILETVMVLSSRIQQDARTLVTGFLRRLGAEIIAFDKDHLDSAVTAFIRFGRGRHPAGLNFGDCMSYAIASIAELPLLFTGEDFARTDIDAA